VPRVSRGRLDSGPLPAAEETRWRASKEAMPRVGSNADKASYGGPVRPDDPPLRIPYGDDPDQFGELHLPEGDLRRGTVTLFHGGFWRAHRDLTMVRPAARALTAHGWRVWNVEYRRGADVHWRDTLADCAAAIDHLDVLSARGELSLSPSLVVGHSAGAHLAAWAATRDAASHIDGLVSLAGVLDLRCAAAAALGSDAVAEFLGATPEGAPGAYAEADPMQRVNSSIRVRCLHSPHDTRVPFDQSQRFVAATRAAGGRATLTPLSGAHADVIDVSHDDWRRALAAINAPWAEHRFS